MCQEENLEVEEIHLNRKRIHHCIACAGGTGLGAIECLHNMEECIKHMGMRAYDRILVICFNKDYMLPALEAAGKLYGERSPDRFDIQY